MKLVFRTVFFLFIFFLISCKKDKKDTQAPSISVTTPSNGQTYKMYDTIKVNARVSDNEHLSSIYVALTDLNHTPVQGTNTVPVQSVSFNFTMNYVLSEFRLQTGSYFLQITASDGYNTTYSYQPITIIESPTIWLGYCVNTKTTSQNIVRYDTTGTINSSIPIIGLYNGMKFGGYWQQLYVNGNNNQPFQAYNLQNSNAIDYTEGLTGNQTNFTCLYTDGYKAYVGFKNGISSAGSIYSYFNTGTQSTSYRFAGGNVSYPYYFTTTSTNNVAIYRNAVPPNNDKLVSFSAFGASYSNASLPVGMTNVIGVFEKSTDSLYVLGNDMNDQSVIYIYTFSGGFSASSIGNLNSKMLSAVKVNNEHVIFSTTSGVYTCNGTNINSAPLLSYTAQKLAYQPKINTLFVASMGNINAYTVSTSSLSSSINTKLLVVAGDSIVDFEVITNK